MKHSNPPIPPHNPPTPRRGRPTKHGEPCKRGSYYLPVRLLSKARRIGKTTSAGIARALEAYKESK